ncbi:MAG: phosphoribosylaminoimidazolesuccinocarboxamide synthase [Chitinophagaceae bacterium]|nr:phosphoribosylaminoimidazolesuccinocarboxamide synthase [Chitinophagaceae bacterium]
MKFNNETNFYKGKVRNVHSIGNDFLVMVASNRISAFDFILPREIPYKGQALTQLAAYFLNATKDIVPNWLISCPAPNVSFGKKATTFPVEMVIRGNLTGHAWRTYKEGKRILCGVALPEGMKENDFFPTPIITPSTKAHEGHDEDISREEIISRGIVSEKDYVLLEKYTHALFAKGKEMAKERGLILVDTKYEFGKIGDEIILIDEIHTPDSSRYFYAEGFEENLKNNLPQRQLSKEFVREWLMENGFQGKEGQQIPTMTDDFVELVTARYIELYEKMTSTTFVQEEISEEEILEKVNRILN